MTKSHHYWKEIAQFKARLRDAIPNDELRELHDNEPAMHLAYAARQFGIVAVCGYGLWHFTNPLVWVPLAILQGFTFFNMTTLLHEVVHNSVFRHQARLGAGPRPGLRQHQRDLGQPVHPLAPRPPRQPGRRPRRPQAALALAQAQRPLVQAALLHAVLMPLYFRAAAREAATYPAELRRTHPRERLATMALQLSVMGAPRATSAAGRMRRVQLVPYFLVFPVAFTLNRLGQHYNIDPAHPLKWSTLMKPSRLWDFLFVYSNYHLEHHYFPRVPFYNLRKLHMRLRPLYAALGLKPHTYREIVWQWFVLNRAPHTNVADMVDFFLVLLLPGAGDELQGLKKGLIELADLIAVNKADGDLAARAAATAADYRAALHILSAPHAGWQPKVLLISSLENRGLDELWGAVKQHRDLMQGSGCVRCQAARSGGFLDARADRGPASRRDPR